MGSAAPKRRTILKTLSTGEGDRRISGSASLDSDRGWSGNHKQQQQQQQTLEQNIASFVDAERMPFLAQKLGWQDADASVPIATTATALTAHLLDSSEIKINTGKGGILGEGDYTRTYEIKSFKWKKGKFGSNRPIPLVKDQNDTTTNNNNNNNNSNNIKGDKSTNTQDKNNAENIARQYAIKCLNPRLHVVDTLSSSDHSLSASLILDTAARRLVREAFYLAHLPPHPFILPFRGWCFQASALQNEATALDTVSLITDRLGDTLEMRMKIWKQLRIKRGGEKEIVRQQENFILGSLQMDLAVIGHTLMHKMPTSDDEGNAGNIRGSSVPKNEAYPADLVALQTNYILQVSHALEYLHDHGIVVRDLRPNTIGFKEYPNHHTVQLFHFGFCRELPSEKGPSETSDRMIPPEPILVSAGYQGNTSLSAPEGVEAFMTDNTQSSALAALHDVPIKTATTATPSTTKTSGGFSLRRTLSNASNASRGSISRQSHATEGVTRSPRSDAKHYRAPETYPVVKVPRHPQKLHENSVQGNPTSEQPQTASSVVSPPPDVLVSAKSCTMGVGTLGSDSGRLAPSFHRSGTNTSNASNTTTSSINSSQHGGVPTTISSNDGGCGDGGSGPAFRRCGTNETTGTNISYSLYSVSSEHQERQLHKQQQQGGDPYKYQYHGYDGKADIYSLAMIYYEMMAEGKPFGKSMLARDSHYYRVQSLGLRPPLRRHHFPRTVKAVLEQAWNPVLEQRPTAKELAQKLTTVLHMLEGKGLSSLHNAKKKSTQGTANTVDVQKLDTIKKLPKRAARLMISVPLHANNNKKAWSSVWDRKECTPKLDSNEIVEAIQAQRVNKEGKKKPAAKKTRPGRAKSLTSAKALTNWLSTLKVGGMAESEVNSMTCEALLGKDYKEKKKTLKS